MRNRRCVTHSLLEGFGGMPPSEIFVSQAWKKNEGEGLVPIVTFRDICTCKVDLYAHALFKKWHSLITE